MRLINAKKLEEKIEYDFKHKKITRYDRELLLHYLDIEMLAVTNALKDNSEIVRCMENVIKGLEAHGSGKSLWVICGNCPYSNGKEVPKNRRQCTHELMHDAYRLIHDLRMLIDA